MLTSHDVAHAAGTRADGPMQRPDCPTDTNNPLGVSMSTLAAQGGYRGTITVHPNIECVVPLPGNAILHVGATVAPGQFGRAIFRVSGSGIGGPGGVSIVASASITFTPSAPELVPRLNADAIVSLPHGAVLTRLDPPSGRFVALPDGHIRLAAPTLYRIELRGVPALLQAATPVLPATLPATGATGNGSPSPAPTPLPLATALALLGAVMARGGMHGRGRGRERERGRRSTRWRILTGAVGLVAAAALAYRYLDHPGSPAVPAVPSGFGTLTVPAGGPVPHATGSVTPMGAVGPPTRLVIARLGVDTPVVPLDIVGGAWQVPAYGAGYLADGVSVWPGRVGNTVIAAHDDRDGSVFRRLDKLRPGDEVRLYGGAHVYRYRVTALRAVPPTRVDVLRPTRDAATLTLITCTPYGVDTARLVARAVSV